MNSKVPSKQSSHSPLTSARASKVIQPKDKDYSSKKNNSPIRSARKQQTTLKPEQPFTIDYQPSSARGLPLSGTADGLNHKLISQGLKSSKNFFDRSSKNDYPYEIQPVLGVLSSKPNSPSKGSKSSRQETKMLSLKAVSQEFGSAATSRKSTPPNTAFYSKSSKQTLKQNYNAKQNGKNKSQNSCNQTTRDGTQCLTAPNSSQTVLINKHHKINTQQLITSRLSKKYQNMQKDFNELKVVNDLIYNEPTHEVSVFKDYLILDDINEFLKRFYKTPGETSVRLPKLYDFYDKYSQVFPNYVCLPESKYMFKNIQKKQKLIDDQFHRQQEAEQGIKPESLLYEDRLFTTGFVDSVMQNHNPVKTVSDCEIDSLPSFEVNVGAGVQHRTSALKDSQNNTLNMSISQYTNQAAQVKTLASKYQVTQSKGNEMEQLVDNFLAKDSEVTIRLNTSMGNFGAEILGDTFFKHTVNDTQEQSMSLLGGVSASLATQDHREAQKGEVNKGIISKKQQLKSTFTKSTKPSPAPSTSTKFQSNFDSRKSSAISSKPQKSKAPTTLSSKTQAPPPKKQVGKKSSLKAQKKQSDRPQSKHIPNKPAQKELQKKLIQSNKEAENKAARNDYLEGGIDDEFNMRTSEVQSDPSNIVVASTPSCHFYQIQSKQTSPSKDLTKAQTKALTQRLQNKTKKEKQSGYFASRPLSSTQKMASPSVRSSVASKNDQVAGQIPGSVTSVNLWQNSKGGLNPMTQEHQVKRPITSVEQPKSQYATPGRQRKPLSSLSHAARLPPQGGTMAPSSVREKGEADVESDITEEAEHNLNSEDDHCTDEQSQAPKDRLLCPSTMVPTCAGFSLTITPQQQSVSGSVSNEGTYFKKSLRAAGLRDRSATVMNQAAQVVSGQVQMRSDGKCSTENSAKKLQELPPSSKDFEALKKHLELYVSTGGIQTIPEQTSTFNFVGSSSTFQSRENSQVRHPQTSQERQRSKFAATVLVPSSTKTVPGTQFTDMDMRGSFDPKSQFHPETTTSSMRAHQSNIYSASMGVNRPNTNMVARESLSSRNKLAQAVAAKSSKKGRQTVQSSAFPAHHAYSNNPQSQKLYEAQKRLGSKANIPSYASGTSSVRASITDLKDGVKQVQVQSRLQQKLVGSKDQRNILSQKRASHQSNPKKPKLGQYVAQKSTTLISEQMKYKNQTNRGVQSSRSSLGKLGPLTHSQERGNGFKSTKKGSIVNELANVYVDVQERDKLLRTGFLSTSQSPSVALGGTSKGVLEQTQQPYVQSQTRFKPGIQNTFGTSSQSNLRQDTTLTLSVLASQKERLTSRSPKGQQIGGVSAQALISSSSQAVLKQQLNHINQGLVVAPDHHAGSINSVRVLSPSYSISSMQKLLMPVKQEKIKTKTGVSSERHSLSKKALVVLPKNSGTQNFYISSAGSKGITVSQPGSNRSSHPPQAVVPQQRKSLTKKSSKTHRIYAQSKKTSPDTSPMGFIASSHQSQVALLQLKQNKVINTGGVPQINLQCPKGHLKSVGHSPKMTLMEQVKK